MIDTATHTVTEAHTIHITVTEAHTIHITVTEARMIRITVIEAPIPIDHIALTAIGQIGHHIIMMTTIPLVISLIEKVIRITQTRIRKAIKMGRNKS